MKIPDEFAPGAQPRPAAGLTALVVEDETALRRFTTRVLEHNGFVVLPACDGVEALELLEERAAEVDVVVSDIVMPRMNGVELMQALSLSHPYMPVILMSGYAPAELTALGIATPCSVVPKPFSAERLLTEVHRCVRRRGGGFTAA